ncbi:hypothetical protein FOCC_FOCC008438, partial [Frankliniella occidentalis]
GSVRGSEPEYAYSCTGPTGSVAGSVTGAGDNVQRARSALDYRDLQDYHHVGGGPRAGAPAHALSASTLRRAHRQLRMLRPQGQQAGNNYTRSQMAGVKRPHQSSHGQNHGAAYGHGQAHGSQDAVKDNVRGSNGGLHESSWRPVHVDSR